MSMADRQPSRLQGVFKPEYLISLAIFVALIVVWHYSTVAFDIPSFILPRPMDVWNALVYGLNRPLADSSGYWFHAGVTLSEAVLGFFLGSLVGTLLGFALAHWTLLGRVTYPYIVGFQALPKVALAPLLIIWFGFGIEGKVMITSVITFFPMMINSIAGYRAVDPDRIDLARSCNAGGAQIFWRIILPSSAPFLFAGLNVAAVLALLGAIVGEFVGARSGLGMLLVQYQQSMQIAAVFAVLFILAVMGFLMNGAVQIVEKRVCFWAQRGGDHGGWG